MRDLEKEINDINEKLEALKNVMSKLVNTLKTLAEKIGG